MDGHHQLLRRHRAARCALPCLVRQADDTTTQSRLLQRHPSICRSACARARGVVSLSVQSIVVIAARERATSCPGPLLTLSGCFEMFSAPYRAGRFAVCDMTVLPRSLSCRTTPALTIRCHARLSQEQHRRGHTPHTTIASTRRGRAVVHCIASHRRAA